MSFDSDAYRGPRQVTDPKAMRALAHPVRLALLDQLAVHGTLTAAQAADLVGESPANCSYHLRTLAKYGFIEPAPGHGRERPWRRMPGGVGIPEVHDDSSTADSAQALTDVIVERRLAAIQEYRSDAQPKLPLAWQRLSGHINVITHLAVDEAARLRESLLELLAGYAGRDADPTLRPEGARPVQLFAYLMPQPLPEEDATS